MFITIYIIILDLSAFFFIIYGLTCIKSKKISTFLWNEPEKYLKDKDIKHHNMGIAILYIFLGLCILINALICNYLSFRLSIYILLIILIAIVPTLCVIQPLLSSIYTKKE